MKVYSVLQIGEYHTNHCEDYLFVGEIGSDKIVCAVMDGCTMAADSYLASTLVGKLLRKIVMEESYKEFYDSDKKQCNLDAYLKQIMNELFNSLKEIKGQLMLNKDELLTTLIIMIVDKNKKEGLSLVIGDGLVCLDGKMIEYDQDNKPDYLGFHIGENFENWYGKQTQKIAFDFVRDVSIATDGIFTFVPVTKVENEQPINPINYLLLDDSLLNNKEMLSQKTKRLEHSFGLRPTDDLAVIRLVV